MMNSKWNDRSCSLEKFTNLHWASFIQLQEASSHIDFQLPSEHTKVTYLIENIINNDFDLRTAIPSIRVNIDSMILRQLWYFFYQWTLLWNIKKTA